MGGLWYCFIHMNMLMHLHIIIEIMWGSAHPKFNPWNLVWKMVFLFDQTLLGSILNLRDVTGYDILYSVIWVWVNVIDFPRTWTAWYCTKIDALCGSSGGFMYPEIVELGCGTCYFSTPMICTHQTLSNLLYTYCPLKPASANFNEGFPRLQRPFQNKSCKSRPHENHAHGDHPNIVYRTQTMIRFSCVFRHPNHDYLIVILYHLQ